MTMRAEERVGHTPGPWRADGKVRGWRGGSLRAVRVSYEKERGLWSPVAMCDARVGDDEAAANARLIAAAPDQNKALREIRDAVTDYLSSRGEDEIVQEIDQIAAAAIAKAEGQEAES